VTATIVKRLVGAVLVGGLAALAASWFGVRPRPLLVVLLVVAVFAVGFLVSDLAADRYELDLAAPRARLVPRWGLDPRFSRLAASLRPPHDPQLIASQLHATLIPIIDERLRARHGIDRVAEPERARAVMGPDLVSYVDSPPRSRRNLMGYLSGIVARIEEL
jgi:hypothetical protein